ncbi:MAG: PAS domain-containing protein [Verrucomicrobia bacterium]|nr:PAS domain-containing protein [Verrucomicrobiota bacterium]
MIDIGLKLDTDLSHSILDAMPVPVFVLDEEMRIVGFNAAAAEMLKKSDELVLRQRNGEVIRCINASASPEGCGHSESCRHCVIRNSVLAAQTGQRLQRQRATMELGRGRNIERVEFLVTAAPFLHGGSRLALVILEDVTELVELRALIPICANCKKVRDDKDYWQSLDKYLLNHLNVALTHGLCPECAKVLFPDAYRSLADAGKLPFPNTSEGQHSQAGTV